MVLVWVLMHAAGARPTRCPPGSSMAMERWCVPGQGAVANMFQEPCFFKAPCVLMFLFSPHFAEHPEMESHHTMEVRVHWNLWKVPWPFYWLGCKVACCGIALVSFNLDGGGKWSFWVWCSAHVKLQLQNYISASHFKFPSVGLCWGAILTP